MSTTAVVKKPKSIELLFAAVYSSETNSLSFLHSQLQINSEKLGVLLPNQYLPIAERSRQCCQLSQMAIEKLIESINYFFKRGLEFSFASVYISPKFFLQDDFLHILTSALFENQIPPSAVCIELPVDVLYKYEEFEPLIKKIKSDGFHFLLNGFGDSYCPVLKLADTDFDYVMLSPDVCDFSADEIRRKNAQSVISYINSMNMIPVATNITSKTVQDELFEMSCYLTTGKLVGNYVRPRGLRINY